MQNYVRRASPALVPTPRCPSAGVPTLCAGHQPSSEGAFARDLLRVIVVGGDSRSQCLEDLVQGLRTFPSARHAGATSIRRALATITSGSTDLVVLLCRWLGHSDYYAIVSHCRATGVKCLPIAGGFSAARRAIASELEGT